MGMIACYQMIEDEMINELLKKTAEEIFETIEELQELNETVLDIDKMWDGLHFLLTNVTASEPVEGNPLSEAVVGVEKFSNDEDADFIAYVRSERVPIIMKELKCFNIGSAIERFQPIDFAENGIYPNIWMHEDNKELQEELYECFLALKKFYEKAEELEKAVIVSVY